ncbi:OmpH family outer membrane protein [Candidatus Pelagibacter sp.]|uniref:OmpH family outer membrane protein n=1 Tax=Candidatus Pelagibacter sp. TaxID=2024849 RepID=UPI003D0FA544
MFKLNNFIIFFLILMTLSVNADNPKKIVYLDLDFILTNTNSGKILLEKLKKIEENKIKEFNDRETNLKNQENKLIASKNILSEDVYNNNILEFKKKLNDYKNFRSNEVEKIKKNRNEEIMKLLNKFNPIIENYMKENSIFIIFDKKNIFIADKNYDITNIIIKEINKTIK